MNRDWLVQSQSEVRNAVALQVQWLAPVMLAIHGYMDPTLVDGLTKPHNPGLEYDIFLSWNQRRLDANQAALARIGQDITRPVNGPVPITVDKRTAIATATSAGTTATISTAPASHGLSVGATVTVAGVSDADYDGTVIVASVPSITTFSYLTASSGLPAATGGSVIGPTTTVSRGDCSDGNTPGPADHVCGTETITPSPSGLSQTGTTVTVTTTEVIALHRSRSRHRRDRRRGRGRLRRRSVPGHVGHLADAVHHREPHVRSRPVGRRHRPGPDGAEPGRGLGRSGPVHSQRTARSSASMDRPSRCAMTAALRSRVASDPRRPSTSASGRRWISGSPTAPRSWPTRSRCSSAAPPTRRVRTAATIRSSSAAASPRPGTTG